MIIGVTIAHQLGLVEMSGNLEPILGGAAGAVVLVSIIVLLICFCLSRQSSVSRTSETGSSDPSLQGNNN